MTKAFLINCIAAFSSMDGAYFKRKALVCKTKLLILEDREHG